MPSNVSQVTGELDTLKSEMRIELLDGSRDGLRETRRQAQSNLTRKDAVASGDLRDNLRVRSVGSGLGWELVSNLDYSVYVEYGTGPQWGTSAYPMTPSVPRFEAPPLTTTVARKIERWMVDKGIVPDRPEHGRRDVAWFIARAISRRGTPATAFMRSAWFQTEEDVRDEIESAFRDALD
jgi:hypothetical protein